jgi:hypothetical protein
MRVRRGTRPRPFAPVERDGPFGLKGHAGSCPANELPKVAPSAQR